jgi:hypothetical protein
MSARVGAIAIAFVLSALAAHAEAQSDEATSRAAQLGDPAHERRRGVVHFGGAPRGGSFELIAGEQAPLEGCALPCELALDEGEWQVRFDSGVSTRITLHAEETLVLEARPDNELQRWLGVLAGVAGAAMLVTTFAVDQGECFAGTSCENVWVIPVLAVGALALVTGFYLAIDASGRVSATTVGR